MIKKILTIFAVFTFAFSQSQILDYQADKVEYSLRDSIITLSGNSQILYDNLKLTADTIFYFTNDKTMLASGNPVLIDGGDTLRGDYIAYNIEKKSGKVRYGLMYSKDNSAYYGENIVRTDSAIYAYHGLYTTCLFPDKPHSHFYCEKIKLIPGDKTVVKPFVLVVGDAPMAALPYFIIPLDKDRTSGWLPIRWGVTLNGRGDVDNVGYYWAVNDYFDLMVAGMVDNFENFLVKAETRYAVKNSLSGNIYTDYSINDKYMGAYNRWSLNFSHDQNLLPDGSFTLRGSGRLVSDKRFASDYSDDTIKLTNQDLTSNLSLAKRFDKIGGYASISWERSQNLQRETIEQNLPSINFALNNRPFISPSVSSDEDTTEKKQNPLNLLSWSYSYKANQKISERTKIDSAYQRTHRGMSHSIPVTLPFNIFKHIIVRPNFTVNHSIFDSYRDTTGRDTIAYERIYDTIPVYAEYEGDIDSIIYYPGRTDSIVALILRDSIPLPPDKIYDTTYYYDKNFDLKKAQNVWWNTGVDISTNLYGIFPIKIGKMQGIRHTLSPSVGYLLTPENNLDVTFMSIGVNSPPMGTKRKQELTFGLNNLFETKILTPAKEEGEKETSRKINLFSARVGGSYNFEADSQKLSNISLSASVPAPKVNLSYSGTYHPYDMGNSMDIPKPLSHSISVTPVLPSLQGNIWSGDLIVYNKFEEYGYLDNIFKNTSRDWSISITPRYSYTMTRENVISEFKTNKNYNLGAGFSFMLSQRWKITWGGTWSFTENNFINQNVALYADLECWDLKLDWYPSGVNEGRIYFVAALKKHRDLKWEQRER
ncbi:MAG: hypothetical protein FWF51_05295 [Chitinivibrionia bacterium]|nr:hypothetical protein [Chitinivibrionia bacterium]